MKDLLRLAKQGRARSDAARDGAVQAFGGIDEDPRGPANRAAPLSPRRAHRRRGDPAATTPSYGPAGVPVDALGYTSDQHRAVPAPGRGGETPSPIFLVQRGDPGPGLVFGSEAAILSSASSSRCIGQVERERADADAHDMRVRIDQPGDHDCPAVFAESVRLSSRAQDWRPCPRRRSPAGEPLDTILADRKTLDIVDQHVRCAGVASAGQVDQEFGFIGSPSRLRRDKA